MGTLIGIIYLSAVVITWLQINLSPFTCTFTIAIVIATNQTTVSFDILYATVTLDYSLIVLNVAQSMHIELRTQSKQNIPIVGCCRKLQPLVYLIGAKLLTIFCYYLPFGYGIAMHLLGQNTVVSIVSNGTTFNHLIILLLTRFAVGTITIFILMRTRTIRDNVNHLSVIYLILLAFLFGSVVLIAFVDHKVFQLFGGCLVAGYYAFSFIVDVIGHEAALLSPMGFDVATKTISITFATFIEHLIDILVIVIYLNDSIGARLIVTILAVACFALVMQQVTRSSCTPLNCNRTDTQLIL